MVERFRGEYGWLSNFADVQIPLKGVVYPSVEHAYMAQKSSDPEWIKFCMFHTAGKVKRKSREIEVRPDWDDVKLDVMQVCLTRKFNQEPFRTKLIQTGDMYIQEGNYHNDKFWGFCLKTNEGENHLGKMIMKIRETLR